MWFGSGAADIQIVSCFCSQLRPNAEIYDAVCCVQFRPRFDIPRRMDGYISGDNGGIPASRCGRVIGETNSNAAVSRNCSSFMAGSLSMAGSDSGGLDGCKVYSGVPQYGSRLSPETFPGYCREAVGLSGTRIRTEHYGNILSTQAYKSRGPLRRRTGRGSRKIAWHPTRYPASAWHGRNSSRLHR